jgi:hypothetical protein
MRLIAIVFTVLAAATFSQATNADDDSKRSAELQVLDRFVGTWDVTVTVKPTGKENITHKMTERRDWTLGGNFVHFQNADKERSALPEYHLLLTYDPATKAYTGIEMFGTARFLLNATWDEATSTMTISGKSPANDQSTFVYKHRFIDNDHSESSAVVRNAEGEVVMELSYKQTRHTKGKDAE